MWYNITMADCITLISGLFNILASITTFIGIIYAFLQYKEIKNQNKKDIQILKIKKAVELSEYYKDNILTYSKAISFILKQCKLYSIIKQAKTIISFDEIEYTEEQLKSIKTILDSKEFKDAVENADIIFNLKLYKVLINQEGRNTVDKDILVNDFYTNILSVVVNNLEYFSMNFTHGLADSTVAYESLSQSFIDIVEMLYYHISQFNKPDVVDPYFRNISELYKIWKNQQNNHKKNKQETFRKYERGTTL